MSNRIDNNGPQPPIVLRTPREVYANLRQLKQSRDPLFISFAERNQRFQSYLLEVDLDKGLIAIDELVPTLGEKFLLAGEAFHIESFHEGVRIAWHNQGPAARAILEDAPCYWAHLPDEISYHQRRDAYRANVPEMEMADAELFDKSIRTPLFAKLLDISATGCRLRFTGDVRARLQPGARLEQLQLRVSLGNISSPVEIRHVEFEEKIGYTFAGLRFHQTSGFEQRNIDRFVYQLQREARRSLA